MRAINLEGIEHNPNHRLLEALRLFPPTILALIFLAACGQQQTDSWHPLQTPSTHLATPPGQPPLRRESQSQLTLPETLSPKELFAAETKILQSAINTPLPTAESNTPERNQQYRRKFLAEKRVTEWLKLATNSPSIPPQLKAQLIRNGFLGIFIPKNRLALFNLMLEVKKDSPNLEVSPQLNASQSRWLQEKSPYSIHPETLAAAIKAHDQMINFLKSPNSNNFIDFFLEIPAAYSPQEKGTVRQFVRSNPHLFVPSPGALATLTSYETSVGVRQDPATGQIFLPSPGQRSQFIIAMANIGLTPLPEALKDAIKQESYDNPDAPLATDEKTTIEPRQLIHLLQLSASSYNLTDPSIPNKLNTLDYADFKIPASAPGSEDASGGAIGPQLLPLNLRLVMCIYSQFIQPYTDNPNFLPSPFDPYNSTWYTMIFLMNMRQDWFQPAYTAIPQSIIKDMEAFVKTQQTTPQLKQWFKNHNLEKPDDQFTIAKALSRSFIRPPKQQVPALSRKGSLLKWNRFLDEINATIAGDDSWRQFFETSKHQSQSPPVHSQYTKRQSPTERHRLKQQAKTRPKPPPRPRL
ncbi:MAG: hypothetical protein GXP43_00620 [bacterium]|nr:hypothetical protein [bacterium]